MLRRDQRTPDRRLEQRYRLNEPALFHSEPAGSGTVRILDVSLRGLCVAVPFRVPVRTIVTIEVKNTTVAGVIKRCACISAREFHVGIDATGSVDRLRVLQRARAVRVPGWSLASRLRGRLSAIAAPPGLPHGWF